MRAQKERMLAEVAADLGEATSQPKLASEKGEILTVRMGCGEAERTLLDSGERVWVEITARVDRQVTRPRLTVFVRDIKGYGLFGFNNHQVKIDLAPDEGGKLRGRFYFTSRLRAGDYSIAVRLEDCLGDMTVMLIDKRLNAVNFKVVREAEAFLGVVNMDGAFEVL
jgi:lipopolysaccharide transport system ATP-binding protein